MKLLIVTTVLFLLCTSAFAAGPDFIFPQVEGQPLVIVQALPDDKAANGDTIMIVENRSNRSVKDFWMVLEGHSCLNKPLWPMIRYSDKSKSRHHTIEPGGRAQIRIAKKLVREIELVAEKTCGKKLPSELAINSVEFIDGSTWTLGDAVRTSAAQQSNIKVEPNVESYGFVHHETTGITSYIMVNGQETPIQFRSDSDPMAVKSLHALNWRVLLPNANGKKIILLGRYFVEPMHTPTCEGCPQVEEYHEFTLEDWYITTPFKATREDCEDCSYLSDENLRTRSRLELTDFNDFDRRDKIELKRFQRNARSQ